MNQDNRDARLIFFGNKKQSLFLDDIKESRFSFQLQNVAQDYGLQNFVVLDQVHGVEGVRVDDTTVTKWFDRQGDFLMTNQKNIGLVVLTADCVPLVLYDSVSHAIALIHAGWKGSYLGVLEKTLQAMQQNYQTDLKKLQCNFGPSARACCYEVSELFIHDFQVKYPEIVSVDFEQKLQPLKIFEKRNLKYYFDNNLFLQQLLKKFGIPLQNIYTDNALCTICNPQFCSFRKEKECANRQITMVALF